MYSRVLVLGLVIGFILGGIGGYMIKGLNATAPVNTVSSTKVLSEDMDMSDINFVSLEGDESGELGDIFMKYVALAVNDAVREVGGGDLQAGFEKMTSGQDVSAVSFPLSLILESANAQGVIERGTKIIEGLGTKKTPTCSELSDLGQRRAAQQLIEVAKTKVIAQAKQYITDNIFNSKDVISGKTTPVECIEKARADLKLYIMIHKRDGEHGTDYFIEYNTKDSKIFATHWSRRTPSSECEPSEVSPAFNKTGGLLYTANAGGGLDGPTLSDTNTPPTGFVKFCQQSGITATVPEMRNPGFNKENCCKIQM